MNGDAVMRKPKWWPAPRKTRRIADQAEAERDRVHAELVVPLRQMRRGDFLTPAIARDIRQRHGPNDHGG